MRLPLTIRSGKIDLRPDLKLVLVRKVHMMMCYVRSVKHEGVKLVAARGLVKKETATLKLHFLIEHQQFYINYLSKSSVCNIIFEEITVLKTFRSMEAWLIVSEFFMLW